jgi:ATP-dependent RNA helicase RhlE
LVLDEADRMLDMGFIDDVRRIAALTPRERQTMLFGATLPPEIEYLSADFQRSPVVIEVARRMPPSSIEQVLYPVGRHLKGPLLEHLLARDAAMESVLVFVDTKRDSDIVARQLREAGIATAVMHGDRTQQDREKALERLRERKVRVLVATNVAARGLDVEDISHVVNYDMPRTVDEYVHRIGRTARAAATGAAYSLVSPGDEAMVQRIEAALGRPLPRVIDTDFDYSVPTPSWAQPSARDLSDTLTRAKSPADVSRRVRFRR